MDNVIGKTIEDITTDSDTVCIKFTDGTYIVIYSSYDWNMNTSNLSIRKGTVKDLY